MIEKFGKSFRDILKFKTNFFEENERLLQKSLEYGAFYSRQPVRAGCKVCGAPLPDEVMFEKHNVGYLVCPKCTHLNGRNEDSDAYCQKIYTADEGQEYAEV